MRIIIINTYAKKELGEERGTMGAPELPGKMEAVVNTLPKSLSIF